MQLAVPETIKIISISIYGAANSCYITQKAVVVVAVSNDCSSSSLLDLSSPAECDADILAEGGHNYSVGLAELMARWASLAYVPPWQTNVTSLKQLVTQEFASPYEVNGSQNYSSLTRVLEVQLSTCYPY